jgi:nucleotide-binding universal stress UspA family protein
MKPIKNIIVATDFSVTARNAYRYAKGLAETLDAKLTMVNVKEHFIMVSDVMTAPLPGQDDESLIKDMEELIAEEDATINKATIKGEVKIKIFKGDPADVLTELSLNNDVDLIVIGTTGLQDLITKIIGSVSLKVANKAHCPVILVPRDAKWSPIEQIMYASNYDSIAPVVVHEINDFAVKIKADIHFVNVKSFDPVFELKENDINMKEVFKSVNNDLYFETHTIYGNNTIDELKKYSEEKNINLMAFVSKHRNFWGNVIHQSITENMALSTVTPIMIIHLDDKK